MGGDGGCEAVLGAGCGVMWGGCNGRWREWGGGMVWRCEERGLRGEGAIWGRVSVGVAVWWKRVCVGTGRKCGGLYGVGMGERGCGLRKGICGAGEGVGRGLDGLCGAGMVWGGGSLGLRLRGRGGLGAEMVAGGAAGGGGGSVGVSRGPLWSSEGALWESYGAEPYRATVGPKRCAGDSGGSLWMWGGALWDSGGAGELLEGGGGGEVSIGSIRGREVSTGSLWGVCGAVWGLHGAGGALWGLYATHNSPRPTDGWGRREGGAGAVGGPRSRGGP